MLSSRVSRVFFFLTNENKESNGSVSSTYTFFKRRTNHFHTTCCPILAKIKINVCKSCQRPVSGVGGEISSLENSAEKFSFSKVLSRPQSPWL